MNVSEEHLIKIIDTSDDNMFHCMSTIDIQTILKDGDERFDNFCIKKVSNATFVET